MPTIDSVGIIKMMLERDGCYPGDPQALRISSYKHTEFLHTTYHVAYSLRDVRNLHTSPFCADIAALWTQETGLTDEGRQFLTKHQEVRSVGAEG